MSQAPANTVFSARRLATMASTALAAATVLACSPRAEAHGISEASRETMTAGGVLDYIWLGAEHMLTGYDHLLFLFGVIFFLKGFRDVVRFITAFTLGHCITLLGATLAGITANPYLIDAVIALSVIYKGFENLDGFKKTFGIQSPNLLGMVFIFGLVHGFGLSTRLQELPLGDEGIIARILAFNVGVELGQVAALTVMLGFFALWRSSKTFESFGRAANIGLVLAGAGLLVFQVSGYLGEDDHHIDHAEEEAGHDDQGHGHDEAGDDHHAPAAATPDKTPEPTPEKAAKKASTKAHSHDKKTKKASAKKTATKKKKRHRHRHGSGKAHSH